MDHRAAAPSAPLLIHTGDPSHAQKEGAFAYLPGSGPLAVVDRPLTGDVVEAAAGAAMRAEH